MINFVPNAGNGSKITAKFKAKVFSFGHVLVNGATLTLYQISEPLQSTSSATPSDPAPYGTDINGNPLNDPIPDTVLNSTTGALISAPATGTSSLLDQWTIAKPVVSPAVTVSVSAPPSATAGGALVYTVTVANSGTTPLNGTQLRLTMPSMLTFAGLSTDPVTVQGSDAVYTMGRLAPGTQNTFQIKTRVAAGTSGGTIIGVNSSMTSGTAQPVSANSTSTMVVSVPGLPIH
jgi:uncharacterized repeat protein (TIGR01451 family)